LMLLDEPTRGIDVGAKAEVFRLLSERARRGLAVVYSTSEVSECLSIAHRIIVMSRGRIAAEFTTDVSEDMIMAASGESAAASVSTNGNETGRRQLQPRNSGDRRIYRSERFSSKVALFWR